MATFEILTTSNVIGGSSGGSSYLSYVPIFFQVGTSDPSVTVLENTLGGTPIWTRVSEGYYIGTLAGVFTQNKTWIPNSDGSRIAMYPISFNAINDYAYIFYWESVDTIALQIFNSTYNNVEYSTVFGGNKLSLPEVRVYP